LSGIGYSYSCAVCCNDCIFLAYSKRLKKLKCLIPNNKSRFHISYEESFDPDVFMDYIIILIGRTNGGFESLCNRGVCNRISSYLPLLRKQCSSILCNKTVTKVVDTKKMLHHIQYARFKIPNFMVLCEILNVHNSNKYSITDLVKDKYFAYIKEALIENGRLSSFEIYLKLRKTKAIPFLWHSRIIHFLIILKNKGEVVHHKSDHKWSLR